METAKFNVIKTTNNKFYFTLVAHGVIMMTSEYYYFESAARKAIEAVKKFSQTNNVDFIDNSISK